LSLVIEFFKVVTLLGDAIFILVASTFLYLNRRKLGLKAGLSVLIAIYLANFLKILFKIPRPPVEKWQVAAGGYSFPSGHATDSSAFWGVIAFEYWSSKKIISYISWILVILVGVSRVVLGVHTWVDVIGGWVLGSSLAAITHFKGEKLSELYDSLNLYRKSLLLIVGYLLSVVIPIPFAWNDMTAIDSFKDMLQAISVVFGIAIGYEYSRENYRFIKDAISFKNAVVRGLIGVLILIVPFSVYEILGYFFLIPILFGFIGFLLVGVIPLLLKKMNLTS